jgi:hypothetical protein
VVVDIGPADIHVAWQDTTLNAFSVDLALTTIIVCVDINDNGSVEGCATFDTTNLNSPSGPAGITTYHDPDTGTVTITATAAIT